MTDLSLLAATRHCRHTALPPHGIPATQLPQSAREANSQARDRCSDDKSRRYSRNNAPG